MTNKTSAMILIAFLILGSVGAGWASAGAVAPPVWSAAWTTVSDGPAGYCQRVCQERCFRRCYYRHHCRRGPQHCYRGTTCHHGVCRDGQTICQPGPVYCPGGWDCVGNCMRPCQWQCHRRFGR
jgi:hypothetical protein